MRAFLNDFMNLKFNQIYFFEKIYREKFFKKIFRKIFIKKFFAQKIQKFWKFCPIFTKISQKMPEYAQILVKYAKFPKICTDMQICTKVPRYAKICYRIPVPNVRSDVKTPFLSVSAHSISAYKIGMHLHVLPHPIY